MLASSSRSAPMRSASATNSAMRAMLPRWSTTLSVSGSRSARAAAAISSLASRPSRPAIQAAPAGSTSCTESCTLSSPAAASRRQALAVGGDAAGDQVDVELAGARGGDQLLEIVAHQRLAAGQVDLQDAQRRRLGEHALPVGGPELVAAAVEIDRVRAVGARERTPVRQLGHQRVGARRDRVRQWSRRLLVGAPSRPRSRERAQERQHVVLDPSRAPHRRSARRARRRSRRRSGRRTAPRSRRRSSDSSRPRSG